MAKKESKQGTLEIHAVEQVSVVDEAESDPVQPRVSYNVTSYGVDFDVLGLVNRLRERDIIIPRFQRAFVWNRKMASRFIESLLLGLPVPGIFLATDKLTKQQVVIDGLQRLRTLEFFYDGYFDPHQDAKTKRVFRLQDVDKRFEGKNYSDLNDADRRQLGNSTIHATVVQQQHPEGDDTSTHHIFERLNSGGMRLAAQEIRCALNQGPLLEMVDRLNQWPSWRAVFGAPSKRLKDQELILRFLGFYFDIAQYERPMSEFLNKFVRRHREADAGFIETASRLFEMTMDCAHDALGKQAFRPERTLNAAVFDAVMVGLARRLESPAAPIQAQVASAYRGLLTNSAFLAASQRATADENAVKTRIRLATEAFANS